MPPLPLPLPPEERTVGQLVAESIRLYGRRFLPSLALGIGPAAINAIEREFGFLVGAAVGAIAFSACYVAACALAGERRGSVVRAFCVGVPIFLAFLFLTRVYILPGLVWLAFVGLTVPILVYEGIPVIAALRRSIRLARTDFVHALGSLATLVLVVFLTQGVLLFLLRESGDQTIEVGAFLASLVVSPLLFLGAALLYFDQAARENAKRVPRR